MSLISLSHISNIELDIIIQIKVLLLVPHNEFGNTSLTLKSYQCSMRGELEKERWEERERWQECQVDRWSGRSRDE